MALKKGMQETKTTPPSIPNKRATETARNGLAEMLNGDQLVLELMNRYTKSRRAEPTCKTPVANFILMLACSRRFWRWLAVNCPLSRQILSQQRPSVIINQVKLTVKRKTAKMLRHYWLSSSVVTMIIRLRSVILTRSFFMTSIERCETYFSRSPMPSANVLQVFALCPQLMQRSMAKVLELRIEFFPKCSLTRKPSL